MSCASPARAASVVASRRPAPASADSSSPSTPRVSSPPPFGRAGSSATTRNRGSGGFASLPASTAAISGDHRYWLSMYEPLRRLDGANVGLEDAELPPILRSEEH